MTSGSDVSNTVTSSCDGTFNEKDCYVKENNETCHSWPPVKYYHLSSETTFSVPQILEMQFVYFVIKCSFHCMTTQIAVEPVH